MLVDADGGAILKTIPVFDEPYGVVSTRDGAKAYVTLEYPGQVVEIDTAAGTISRTFKVGEFPRGIALAADESRLFVTEYYTAAVVAIDLASGKVVDRWQGAPSENLARQIAVHPRRPKAYVPHIRSRVNVNRGEGSVVPFVSVIDLPPGEGKRRKPIPMDAFNSVFVVANPWEVAVSPDGSQFCAVFAGTNDMYVCSVVDDDTASAGSQVVNLGSNPQSSNSPPTARRFTSTTRSFQIAAYDASRLEGVSGFARIAGDEILRGKSVYTALEPMVGRRWISCSVVTRRRRRRRTWRIRRRETTALFGMAWTRDSLNLPTATSSGF